MKSPFKAEYFKKRGKLFPFLKASIYSVFIKLFLNPENLLDVGCARGELVRAALRLGIESFGVDVSQAVISQLPPLLKERCKVGNILDLPFKDKEFDVVSCLTLLEHVPPEATERALRELVRVSRRYILIQICVKDNSFEGRHYLLDPTHVNVQSSFWWVEKFRKLGLKFRGIPKLGVFLVYGI